MNLIKKVKQLCDIWSIICLRYSEILLAISSVCLLNSCSLSDDRDLCCPGSTVMLYRYLPYGRDQFREYIHTLDHYLYDQSGHFVGKVEPGADLQRQPLYLDEGIYTMITVGNASDFTLLQHSGEEKLDNFFLSTAIRNKSVPDAIYNGDELYWGIKRFIVDNKGFTKSLEKNDEDAPTQIVTFMNNIHCHLQIRVEWTNMPPYIGEYELKLEGIATRYSMNPDNALTTGNREFIVPSGDHHTSHTLSVPLKSRELYGEFITLRYTDDNIPVLHIRFGEEEITPPIDLSRAFRSWGWKPSNTHVQDYRIRLVIRGNGSVDVSPDISATVEDWVNGGIFG